MDYLERSFSKEVETRRWTETVTQRLESLGKLAGYDVQRERKTTTSCWVDIGIVTQGVSIGIEIKSSKSGMSSIYGRCFDLDYNYLLVPSDLADYSARWLQRHHWDYAGIISFDRSRKINQAVVIRSAEHHSHKSSNLDAAALFFVDKGKWEADMIECLNKRITVDFSKNENLINAERWLQPRQKKGDANE